jgi:hypothetical protein
MRLQPRRGSIVSLAKVGPMPEFSIQQGTTIAIREAVVVTERRVRISVVMEMVARKPTIGKVGVGPAKAEPGKIAAEAAPWECAAAHVAFNTANYGDAVAVSHRVIHAGNHWKRRASQHHHGGGG